MPVERFKVLECSISAVDMETAYQAVLDRIQSKEGSYVCFSNVHTVVTAKQDKALLDATNNAYIAMPDGRPLSIVGRWKGVSNVQQVAGPDFMPYFFEHAKGIKHYFYGSTPETLEKLVANFSVLYPESIIVGVYSPPFRELTIDEIENDLKVIRRSGADIVWVGLGAPKQEYWMAEHWESLKPAVLMGVGAAFDFHAGDKPRAPEWMKKYCLEWFHRLCSEPGRLWKRYFITNTKFISYIILDALFRKS